MQNDLLKVGHAYVERVILEQFLAGVAAIEDEKIAEQLGKLAALFALTHIEKDAAWFLEHGYISGSKSIAIRREVDVLVYELRHQALHLVEAFAIPNELLGAPIAQPQSDHTH